MRRTEQLQGFRLMKLEKVYDRTFGGVLSVAEVAEIPGMSPPWENAGDTSKSDMAASPVMRTRKDNTNVIIVRITSGSTAPSSPRSIRLARRLLFRVGAVT